MRTMSSISMRSDASSGREMLRDILGGDGLGGAGMVSSEILGGDGLGGGGVVSSGLEGHIDGIVDTDSEEEEEDEERGRGETGRGNHTKEIRERAEKVGAEELGEGEVAVGRYSHGSDGDAEADEMGDDDGSPYAAYAQGANR